MNGKFDPHTLFVSDLDGTLLNKEAIVSARSAFLLNEAISRGASFTIATARTPATVASLIRDVEIKLPAVVMTGAMLWNRDHNRYSNSKFIIPDEARKILETYRRLDFPAFIFTLRDNHIHIYHSGRMSEHDTRFMLERIHSPYKTFHIDPETGTTIPESLDNVLLFYAMQPDVPAQRAYDAVRESVRCTPLFYHDIYGDDIAVVETFAHDSSKAAAIDVLARQNGFSRIVAFGDNINDLPMLRRADVAVVPENAVAEVKEMADIIIADNGKDSVAEFIATHPDI